MNAVERFSGDTPENENLARFDAEVERSGMFYIYREVVGRYVHSLPTHEPKDCRIDRILIPTKQTQANGRTIGAVGVEAKAGGHKMGPPICQALDYRRAAFRLPGGCDLLLRWVFLFPLGEPGGPPAGPLSGPLGSVLAQNAIGTICWTNHGGLMFVGDSRNVARTDDPFAIKMPQSGGKLGSR